MRKRRKEEDFIFNGERRVNLSFRTVVLTATFVLRTRYATLHQQNFHLLSQFTQVTNVVMGSSALRVCSW